MIIYNLKSYLSQVFTADTQIRPMDKYKIERLPLFASVSYDVFEAEVLGQQLAFIHYPVSEAVQPSKLQKECRMMETALGMPIAFVFERLEIYARNKLLELRIPFVVPYKQLYLPFLAISFNERNDRPRNERDKLTPASQCMLLYHLQVANLQGKNFKEISDILGYSAMTITRAAQQLEAFDLVKTERKGEKEIKFEKKGQLLWDAAAKYLITPIKMTKFIDKLPQNVMFFEAGERAMPYFSNLATGERLTYATSWDEFRVYKKHIQDNKGEFASFEGQIKLEIWHYNPGLLSTRAVVDPLSLYLSMQKEKDDERIEIALEELINNVKWLKD